MLGYIQFIGELCKVYILKENVIQRCIEKLLNAEKTLDKLGQFKGLKFISGDVDETNLEALGKLMTTVGKRLDSGKNATYMKAVFGLLERHANNTKLNSRMRYMIRDLEELRSLDWKPRRVQAKAKTLEEIRREAADEQARASG
ncbi:unnamed protein product [Choristocarpus tenellus]